MKKIIIFDFDGTLTPYGLPEFEILQKCGLENGALNPKFLMMAQERSREKKIDMHTAIYDTFFDLLLNSGFDLTDDNITFGADNIKYNEGVEEFLEFLNKNNIQNYIISSGLKVYLDKTKIAKYFNNIYASIFKYDKDGRVVGLDFLMDEKKKVIMVKKILSLNGIKENDCSDVIYIGDGMTDAYAMEYVKTHGGKTILVFKDEIKDKDVWLKKDIISFFTPAIFSSNSDLRKYIEEIAL